MLTEIGKSQKSKRKPKIRRRAKVAGLAETARRVGRTQAHVYLCLTGQRKSPCIAEYQATQRQVIAEANAY
jgi:hypothetical protein